MGWEGTTGMRGVEGADALSAEEGDKAGGGRKFSAAARILRANSHRARSMLLMLLLDIGGFLSALYVLIGVRLTLHHNLVQFFATARAAAYGHSLLLLGFIVIVALQGGYRRRWSSSQEYRHVGKAILSLMCLDLIFMAIYSQWLPASEWRWYICLWPLLMASVLTWRWVGLNVLRNLGIWSFPAIIVGTGQGAVRLTKFLEKSPRYGVRILSFVRLGETVEVDDYLAGRSIVPCSWLNRVQTLSNVTVFVALESGELERYSEIVNRLSMRGVCCTVVTPFPAFPVNSTEIIHVDRFDCFSMSVGPLRSWRSKLAKRLIDIVGASILLLLLLPLLAGIGVMIWRRDGRPVLYRQIRRGRNGKDFTFLKFRSMYRDADQQLFRWKEENPELYAEYVANNFKLRDDPRIIPGGRMLRQTSADELPQLINVLTGQMSLVGPRPILPREVEHYEGGTFYYDMMRPGITGLWQVSGRSNLEFSDRVELDRIYVKNWSLWEDLAILAATVKVIFGKEGAY